MSSGIGYKATYQAYPGSQIGRQLAFYKIKHVDTNSGPVYGSSGAVYDYRNFTYAIQAIQTVAEIMTVGAPTISNSWSHWIVGLAYDTATPASELSDMDNQMANTIQAALRAIPALNDNEYATVERVFMFGEEWLNASDYVDAIAHSQANNNLLPTPVDFAPGSVEENELIQIRESL
jgi:hypothetical protein